MRFSKISIVMLPFVLGGCDNSSNNDAGSFYMPPVTVAPVPVTSTPPTTISSGCGCPEKAPAVMPAPIAAPDWHPLEGHLVRAGELVMELKRKNGGINPSHAAMAAHIQANMGFTAPQAEMVLEELGL